STELRESLVIQVDERPEPRRLTANDGQHQRQPVMRGTDDGFRAAADTDPGSEPSAFDRWKDMLAVERRPRRALPGDRPLLQQPGEQLQLFLEQRLVLVQRITEERKGLGEGPPAQDHFRPPT